MVITKRLEKGTALTYQELDDNFDYLDAKIDSVSVYTDILYSALPNVLLGATLEVGKIYRVTNKSNILILATSATTYEQLNVNRDILTLTALTPYTYNYTFEVLGDFAFPKILAYDSSGETVAVKVTNITKTSLILTSAVNCTVRIEIWEIYLH